ncbi:MAG TPA: HIT family protein [Phycisphaerae bacterium]|jgi:histidine triad (HIT) family protein|nr:HIT family protein [Phycisphaerae bacterium]
MSDCIFCKIAAGQIPCTRVYEDEVCLVFMDIQPISPGHTLLIPKKHYDSIMEMPVEESAHLGRQLPALAAAVRAAVKAEALNVLQNNGRAAGQAVSHLHIHLIPRWPGDGLGFRWPAKSADAEVLKRQAEAIRTGLGG